MSADGDEDGDATSGGPGIRRVAIRGSERPTPPGVVRVRAEGSARPRGATTAGPDVRSRRMPLSRERIGDALRMVESKREAPHLYVGATIDVGACVALLGERGSGIQGEMPVAIEDVVLAACAGALARCPGLNGRFAGDAIEAWEEIHLAFSVAVGGALAWPVLRSPGRLPLDALSALRRELARRVASGEIAAEEESGSTFSVALLGELGIESASAVIRPPQAAILAVGAPVRRPVVRGHGVVAGWVVELGLSCDQRAVALPLAARFLADVRRQVEQPTALLGD